MLNQLRANHPYLYCILTMALFLLTMMFGANLFTLLLLLAGPAAVAPFETESYLLQAVNDLMGLLLAVLLLWRTRRLWVYTRRGRGFLDGLLVGMFPFVMLSFSLSVNLALIGPPEGAALKAGWRVAAFFLAMLMIGLAEESVFRGIIAQTLLEHFGPSRAGVWKACLLSGLLFGAGHMINLISSQPLGVLIQCCITASLGMLYAAVYFRTGNLWVLIFLHTLQDVAALIHTGLYDGTGDIGEVVSSYDPSMLMGVVVYLIPTVFLLRKKRCHEVALFWGMDPRLPADAGQPEQSV